MSRLSAHGGWVVTLCHLVVSGAFHLLVGVGIEERMTFARVWQLAPLTTLRDDLGGLLSVLHMQPPGYNVLVGVLIKLFGYNGPQALHAVHVAMGAAIAGMVFGMSFRLTGRRWAGLAAGLFVALHPALILFEAFTVYDLVSTFLVTSVGYCFVRHTEGGMGDRWLYAALGMLATLMLTRGMYHLILILPVAALAVLARRGTRQSALLAVLLAALPPTGWYLKNQFQFGFFGASSHFGLSFSRVAFEKVKDPEAMALAERGLVAPIVGAFPKFYELVKHPERYAAFGYDEPAPHPELGRNNLNNINIIPLARDYLGSSINAMAVYPDRWVATLGENVLLYLLPPAKNPWLSVQRAQMESYEAWFSTVLDGAWLGELTAREGAAAPFLPSYRAFTFPTIWVLFAVGLWKKRRELGGVRSALAAEPGLALIALLLSYSFAVATLFEAGENDRYAFYTEPLWTCFALAILFRFWDGRREPQPVPLPGPPPAEST